MVVILLGQLIEYYLFLPTAALQSRSSLETNSLPSPFSRVATSPLSSSIEETHLTDYYSECKKLLCQLSQCTKLILPIFLDTFIRGKDFPIKVVGFAHYIMCTVQAG